MSATLKMSSAFERSSLNISGKALDFLPANPIEFCWM